MQIDNTWFSILESVYSWPNVFIPVICGFLLDRLYGIRIGMIIFTLVICVGQLIVAFGGIYNNFPVMFVGRIIYGYVLRYIYAVHYEKVLEPKVVLQ